MEKSLLKLSLILFSVPGVIVRIAATQLVCRLMGLPILKVPTHPIDDVEFAPPRSVIVHSLLLVGIGVVNLAIGTLLALPIAIQWIYFGNNDTGLFALGVLGLSIASEALPGGIDVATFWIAGHSQGTASSKPVVSAPTIAILYVIMAIRGTFAHIWLPLAAIRGITITIVQYYTGSVPM